MAFKIPRGKCEMSIANDDNTFKCNTALKRMEADLTVEPGQYVQVEYEGGDAMQPKVQKCEIVTWGYVKGFRFKDGADSPFAPARPRAPKAEPKFEVKGGDKH